MVTKQQILGMPLPVMPEPGEYVGLSRPAVGVDEPPRVTPGPPRSALSARGSEHYTSKSVQPWDAMKAWMSRDEFTGFLRGNAIKYLARYKDKDGLRDLKKAQHYIDKLIDEESR